METDRDFTEHLNARLGLSYTCGDSDNGDLGQISPLQARLNLDYQHNTWLFGTQVISATEQSHFNPAVDVAEATPAFTVVNFYAHWDAVEYLSLEAGVENIFDKAYAYHLNLAASDPFNPTAIQVNEPGRQLGIKLRYSF